MPDGAFGFSSRATGGRTNIVQHYRTIVANNPPASNVLLEGEIGIEMADPMRLWIGVPPSLDPSGRKLLFDKTLAVWPEAPTDGQTYGRNGSQASWLPVLPLTGGALTGPLVVPLGTAAQPGLMVGGFGWGIWNSGSSLVLQTGNVSNLVMTPNGDVFGAPVSMSPGTTFTLAADPTSALQAATKQYVDAVQAQLANYLLLSGGQMQGPLITIPGTGGSLLGIGIGNNTTGFWGSGNNLIAQTGGATNLYMTPTGDTFGVSVTMAPGTMLALSADATQPLQAVTLQQMTAAIAAGTGASITVSDTPPASPHNGALWFDSVSTSLYVSYNDGNSQQWVVANNGGGGGIADAPSDGYAYGRENVAWTRVLPLSGGTLTGSLGIGTAPPTSPAPSSSSLFVQGSATAIGFDLNAYMSGSSAWTYLAAGAAGRIALDTTGRLSLMAAASGAAGGAITWGPAVSINSGGWLVMAGAPLMPADAGASPFINAQYITLPLNQTINWNLYLSSASQWQHLGAGYGGYIYADTSGNMNFSMYGNGAAGSAVGSPTGYASLQQSGRFQTNGALASLSGRIISGNAGGGIASFCCYQGSNWAAGLYGDGTNLVLCGMDGAGNAAGAAWFWCTPGAGTFPTQLNIGSTTSTAIPLNMGVASTASCTIQMTIASHITWQMVVANNDNSVTFYDASYGYYTLKMLPNGGGTHIYQNLTVGGSGINYTAAYSTGNWFVFGWNNVVAGAATISVDNGGAAYALANASDERLKQDIAPSTFDGLAAVLATPLHEFRWRDHSVPGYPVDDPNAELVPIGFVAQRVASVFKPAARIPKQSSEAPPGAIGAVWNVDDHILIAAAYDAIRQLNERVKKLEG